MNSGREISKTLTIAITIAMATAFSGLEATADDGGISFGGSPHLLKGHASVSMKSEIVQIDIHEKSIKVDCKFVFHNSGPACPVRMGFPDEGLGAAEPYQGDPVPTGPELKATFTSYDSYVDGKKVPTKLVPTNDRGLYWHTKTVTFKAASDCIIRDVYSLPPGGQVTNENGVYSQTCYILHTGASWHGPIGKADIIVNFAPDAVPPITHVKDAKPLTARLENQDIRLLKWSTLPPGTVLYDASCTPSVQGNKLKFELTNFRPEKKDDIHLYYGWKKLTNMPN